MDEIIPMDIGLEMSLADPYKIFGKQIDFSNMKEKLQLKPKNIYLLIEMVKLEKSWNSFI